MEYVLETLHLSKRYKSQWALKDVNLHIAKGDIYGFVGENGSGKTTVIRLVTGLISPTEGNVALFGVKDDQPDILQQRKKVGAIVEAPAIYLNMSAAENLRLQATILGITENVEKFIQNALCEVGLQDLYNDNKKAGNFSLGMRQRLGIAMALMNNPELIILDEPMNGLDPTGIVEIRELILKLNRQNGITFLISSHILSELSLVATKYGIISKGKLLAELTAEELQQECQPSTIINVDRPEALQNLLNAYLPPDNYVFTEFGVRIYGNVKLNELLKKIIDADIEIMSVNSVQASIETYYLSLVGGMHNA